MVGLRVSGLVARDRLRGQLTDMKNPEYGVGVAKVMMIICRRKVKLSVFRSTMACIYRATVGHGEYLGTIYYTYYLANLCTRTTVDIYTDRRSSTPTVPSDRY
jgi:hypothetical protein